VVQPNAAYADAHIDALVAALVEVTGVTSVVMNGTGRARTLEGLDEKTDVMVGAVDGPIAVQMNGATYMADLIGGQKTGLFFDQRPNHAFAASLSKGARVLDVFSHVGGFGHLTSSSVIRLHLRRPKRRLRPVCALTNAWRDWLHLWWLKVGIWGCVRVRMPQTSRNSAMRLRAGLAGQGGAGRSFTQALPGRTIR